jgi:uncharacterized protein YjcR
MIEVWLNNSHLDSSAGPSPVPTAALALALQQRYFPLPPSHLQATINNTPSTIHHQQSTINNTPSTIHHSQRTIHNAPQQCST